MMFYASPSTGQTADFQQSTDEPFSPDSTTDDGYYCSGLGNLVASLSDGSLSLLKPRSQGELIVFDKWHAHDHEPWIAAWNYWDSSVIYSGDNFYFTRFLVMISDPSNQAEMIFK